MKIGIISDIHANFAALYESLNFFSKEAVDKIVCAGDISGYGGQPNECIDILRERNIICISGNHDLALPFCFDFSDTGNPAEEALIWQKRVLKEENKKFIYNLKAEIVLSEISLKLVHSTPASPSDKYINNEKDIYDAFKSFDEKICIIGHTHIPAFYEFDNNDNKINKIFNNELILKDNCKYLINAGSIGQPRDGNPELCCLIYKTNENKITRYRLPYNIKAAQEAIKKAGLPLYLARRLEKGK